MKNNTADTNRERQESPIPCKSSRKIKTISIAPETEERIKKAAKESKVTFSKYITSAALSRINWGPENLSTEDLQKIKRAAAKSGKSPEDYLIWAGLILSKAILQE